MAKTATPEAADRTITKEELKQVDRANKSGKQPSCSYTACGCSRAAGTAGPSSSRGTAIRRWVQVGPTIPTPVGEAKAHPDVFVPQVRDIADHYDAIIRKLDKKPAIVGHSFGGLLTQILAERGLAAAGGHRSRTVSRHG